HLSFRRSPLLEPRPEQAFYQDHYVIASVLRGILTSTQMRNLNLYCDAQLPCSTCGSTVRHLLRSHRALGELQGSQIVCCAGYETGRWSVSSMMSMNRLQLQHSICMKLILVGWIGW